jgi:rhodanese-related sulfurtransferase
MIKHIDPMQLAARLQKPDPPAMIDVREQWEHEVAHIPGVQLHVLNDIGTWARTLDKTQSYVLVCHHGGRSMMACQLLQSMGFADVTNLEAGTDGWAAVVDPNMTRY